MTTRATIFARAFAAIGIAASVYEVEPDERAEAASALDAMMAQWLGDGIDLGYVATGGDPQPDIDMATPEWADTSITYNLALEIAPIFGKLPAARIRTQAKRGYGLAVAKTLQTPNMPAPRVPIIGAGDCWRRRRFR